MTKLKSCPVNVRELTKLAFIGKMVMGFSEAVRIPVVRIHYESESVSYKHSFEHEFDIINPINWTDPYMSPYGLPVGVGWVGVCPLTRVSMPSHSEPVAIWISP
jgi:hypothetical protein